MYARQIDQKSAVFQKAIEVGDAYMLRSKVKGQIDRAFLYNCYRL